jgi:hypothetical protein
LAEYPDGTKRAIEVKGRGEMGDIEVTENEWAKACNLRGDYWLHAVFDCASPFPRLVRIQDPFGRLVAQAKGTLLIPSSAVLSAEAES